MGARVYQFQKKKIEVSRLIIKVGVDQSSIATAKPLIYIHDLIMPYALLIIWLIHMNMVKSIVSGTITKTSTSSVAKPSASKKSISTKQIMPGRESFLIGLRQRRKKLLCIHSLFFRIPESLLFVDLEFAGEFLNTIQLGNVRMNMNNNVAMRR